MVVLVCLTLMSGFFFSHSVICSLRKSIAPACSFAKKVRTPVIRSVEDTFCSCFFTTVLAGGDVGVGSGAVSEPPKFRGACEMLVPSLSSKGIGSLESLL